jgi:hypothetical protein
VTCVSGEIIVSAPDGAWPDEHIGPGGSLLLPATIGVCTMRPDAGRAELLLARLS